MLFTKPWSRQLSVCGRSIINKKSVTTSMVVMNPFPGLDIGIPLTIFENAYTTLHYGENMVTAKSILLEFLIGYYVYGTDRYQDALAYAIKPYSTTKKDLYDYINTHKRLMVTTLFLSEMGILSMFILSEHPEMNIPFLLLLESTRYYSDMKKYLGMLKPLYISLMWTAAAIILPCVMYEHNYNILYSPQDYLPCTLTLFAASNIVDNKDIVEDYENGIQTIPVVIGEDNSNKLSMLALIASSLLLGFNPHYLDEPIFNSLLEIQNGAISFLPFALNATLA